MKFRERLRDLRLRHHMSIKEVAQIIGVPAATYASYESRGSQPNFDVLIRIAKALEVTTDFLLGADQDVCQPIVDRKPFSENLKRIRMETGMSGKIIAEKLGISYSAYMNYENRASQPPFDILCKIADILQVSTDELLGHKLENFSPLTYAGFVVDDTQQPVNDRPTYKIIDTIDKTEYYVPKELIEALLDTIRAMQKTVYNHGLVKTMLTNSL